VPDWCTDNPEYTRFLLMEFGAKSLSPLIFFILGSYRYCMIKDYGMGQCKYSRFFKAKLAISVIMGLSDLLYPIVIFALPSTIKDSTWINRCNQDYFGLFYVFQSLAWFFGTWLMMFEYKRLLSEAWYSNQLFWVMNLTLEVLTVATLINDYV
jgi:hypothetical protein